MSKNTASSAFRKIDVDQFDEANFKDDEGPAQDSGFAGVSESEIANLLQKGQADEALPAAGARAMSRGRRPGTCGWRERHAACAAAGCSLKVSASLRGGAGVLTTHDGSALGLASAPEDKGKLLSNRAAAYMKLDDADAALRDADACIKLQPQWAKGFARKGAALRAAHAPRMRVLVCNARSCRLAHIPGRCPWCVLGCGALDGSHDLGRTRPHLDSLVGEVQ